MSGVSHIHIVNVISTLAGCFTLIGCLLAFLIVRSELGGLEESILDATKEFQAQSDNIWTSLRDIKVNPETLRSRRQVIRRMLGRPLATSSAIGYSQMPMKSKGKSGKRIKIEHTTTTTQETIIPIEEMEEPDLGPDVYDEKPPKFDVYSYEIPSGYTYGRDTAAETTAKKAQAEIRYSSFGYSGPSGGSPPAYQQPSYAGYGQSADANQDNPKFDFQSEIDEVPKCKCSSENSCPAGPPGPKGAPGKPGDNGEEGRSAEAGRDMDDVMTMAPPLSHCITCPQGEPGSEGAEGKRGQRGLRGARGAFGDQGRNGAPGLPGIHGSEGVPGEDGETGSIGNAGMDGMAGIGLPGAKGQSGAEGIAGEMGDAGLDGIEGLVGIPGSRGGHGDHGRHGENGKEGEQGIDGEPGLDAEYCPCRARSALPEYGSPINRLLRA